MHKALQSTIYFNDGQVPAACSYTSTIYTVQHLICSGACLPGAGAPESMAPRQARTAPGPSELRDQQQHSAGRQAPHMPPHGPAPQPPPAQASTDSTATHHKTRPSHTIPCCTKQSLRRSDSHRPHPQNLLNQQSLVAQCSFHLAIHYTLLIFAPSLIRPPACV